MAEGDHRVGQLARIIHPPTEARRVSEGWEMTYLAYASGYQMRSLHADSQTARRFPATFGDVAAGSGSKFCC